jgi:hypothetical protein
MGPMMVTGKRTDRTAEETAAIISATAVARGKDSAQTAIIGLLGRGKPFTRVHVGITDAELGKTSQVKQGYTVTAICTASSSHTVVAVGQAVAAWLEACHGSRFEAKPPKAVVKPGAKTLYLAVAYGATA